MEPRRARARGAPPARAALERLSPLRVLHVSPEVAPFAKTGGLGDVLQALPAAQAALGADVTVVLPRYPLCDARGRGAARVVDALTVPLGGERHEVAVWELRERGVRVWFIEHISFERDGIYGDASGSFGDNPWRYALLGKAALAACEAKLWWPNVVHAHDWAMGALACHAKLSALAAPTVVFTVHNLAYQGRVGSDMIELLGLPPSGFHPDGYEFYGEVSLLKAGLWAADEVTTVSPRYAMEIQTPQFGEGLDGYLRARTGRLRGIINGVDYTVWDPSHDVMLPARYDADALDGKRECKRLLCGELGLPDDGRPLCATVSRLTDQKGIDLLADALGQLGDEKLAFVLVGAGDVSLAERVRAARPADVAVRIAVDEKLAHRVFAAADLYVMPSRFEPCGLSQMYSMRYGTLPIVSPVGGLLDTVRDETLPGGTGFIAAAVSVDALAHRWRDALHRYREPTRFAALQQNAMRARFDWPHSATAYLDLYGDTIPRPRST